jgi:hypothetical protein
MHHWTAQIERADALLLGRVTYEMMESAWRKPAIGTSPAWIDEWQFPFAQTIEREKKYVVSPEGRLHLCWSVSGATPGIGMSARQAFTEALGQGSAQTPDRDSDCLNRALLIGWPDNSRPLPESLR